MFEPMKQIKSWKEKYTKWVNAQARVDELEDHIKFINESHARSKKTMFEIHAMQLKHTITNEFDWEVKDDLTPAQRMAIYNNAFLVDGFKEMLAFNVFQYKRHFIESKQRDINDDKSLYFAECYQNILTKMRHSHEKITEPEKFDDEMMVTQ